MLNPFFKNVGPFNIEKLLGKINIENKQNFKKDKIFDISDLATATDKDLTFLLSKSKHFTTILFREIPDVGIIFMA